MLLLLLVLSLLMLLLLLVLSCSCLLLVLCALLYADTDVWAVAFITAVVCGQECLLPPKPVLVVLEVMHWESFALLLACVRCSWMCRAAVCADEASCW
jgi:hypothetical protein